LAYCTAPIFQYRATDTPKPFSEACAANPTSFIFASSSRLAAASASTLSAKYHRRV